MGDPDCLLEGIEFSDIVVMDAGTGAGATTRLLAKKMAEARGRGRIVSVDLDIESFQLARRRLGDLSRLVEFVRADLSEMPQVQSESFDLVVCTATMCAINDRPLRALRALSEYHRVLRKGGRLIIREEYPQPRAIDPDDEVHVKRWQFYKAVAELSGEGHYTEIHPEELQFAASLVGFRDIAWQRFEGGPIHENTMEEWREIMSSMVGGVANPQLQGDLRDMVTQIYSTYREKGGRNPPSYVMKMTK